MTKWTLGIIGGSGLYQVPGIEGGRWETVVSPWGEPSDQVYRGTLNGIDVVFLPRHGRGHRLGPTQLNYRANIDVMKRAGCTDILSLSACGSLKEEMAPGDFGVVDQFIDRTFAREKSCFGEVPPLELEARYGRPAENLPVAGQSPERQWSWVDATTRIYVRRPC